MTSQKRRVVDAAVSGAAAAALLSGWAAAAGCEPSIVLAPGRGFPMTAAVSGGAPDRSTLVDQPCRASIQAAPYTIGTKVINESPATRTAASTAPVADRAAAKCTTTAPPAAA